MDIALNYGRGTLGLSLTDDLDVHVIAKRAMPIIGDSDGAIRQAIAAPVGAVPLADLAREARTACILICDITRPVPNGLFLPILIRGLLDAGMPASAITILVATGLHRPNEGEELAELVGDRWVSETVAVRNHFARDAAAHKDVGATSKGTVVKLDRRFVEADLRIATGLVEPHFMAGYSGGRKVIAPGIAHQETITTFHSARFIGHPRAANCVLEGNPLHEDQLEIMKLIGGAYALNAVIDEHRNLSFVNFGEIVESHMQAVAHFRRYAEVTVPRRFRTVVTSAAGYPLDRTYYQTVKSMVAPLEILEPGGNLIIASECGEGFGSKEYADAQARLIDLGPDRFLGSLHAKRYADIDEWQSQMQLKALKAGAIHLYSTCLPADQWPLTGVRRAESLEAAIAASVEQSGDHSIAVIPEGPYVVPQYRA